MKKLRSSALRSLLALFAVALLAASCVSNEDDAATEEPATTTSAAAETETDEPAEPVEEEIVLTDSWRGVTADTIHVGVSMLNFKLLVDLGLSPAGWGDQQAVWEALIADLNDRGGINGRMVEAVYDFYSPIDPADAERVCSVLTQDNESFAVLGGFVGPASPADVCVTDTNSTIMVGGEIAGDELSRAKVPWFHSSATADYSTINLLNLLEQTGRTEGAVVFTMGGAAAAEQEASVLAQLEARGIEVVGSAIIEAGDGDTLAQDDELAVAFERFKSSGANTLMIFGTPSSEIRGAGAAGLAGEIAIWSNNPGGLANLGATITDKSIADGVLAATGATDDEIWDDPAFQEECVAPVTERIAEADLRTPSTYEAQDENWFNSLRRYCHALSIFVQIATAAGGDLTPTSFGDAAYGPAFNDFYVPGLGASSVSMEKRGAQDLLRLSEYDSTYGDGGLVPLTELLDAFEG